MEETEKHKEIKKDLSCTACFDALWFCYSPVHQLQQYYRYGTLDNCFEKWNSLMDCFRLKTKPSSEMQAGTRPGEKLSTNEQIIIDVWFYEQAKRSTNGIYLSFACPDCLAILEAREKDAPHIWSFRTPKEASQEWNKLYGHLNED